MDGPVEIPEEIWEQDIFEPCEWCPHHNGSPPEGSGDGGRIA